MTSRSCSGRDGYRPLRRWAPRPPCCRRPNCPGLCRQPQPGMRASYCPCPSVRTGCWCWPVASTPTRDTTCATSCIRFGRPVRQGRRLWCSPTPPVGLRADLQVGQPVLISDHLNLTARSPLVGGEFVDLTDAYSPRLRELARQSDPQLAEGVYAGLPGPHYETPAEIRMLQTLGADLVGMSTVHETIAARAAGAEVLGVSLVTNLAAGITGEPLSHAEVLAAGAASATRMGALLADVIARF
ncbi:purine nucleoside phosphorylase deoD [Mycobacterium tuberculosis C]|nr:purine nucleoside phosphorylase deoD [Mycobacterium tuberculosis C]